MLSFRRAMEDDGYEPTTIASTLRQLGAIFRRMGPPGYRNPAGLNVIPHVPYVRPPKVQLRRPVKVHAEDISLVYLAAEAAEWPRGGIPASWWWRTLLVVAFNTGLRRGDLWSIEMEVIDLGERRLYMRAEKTGKDDWFPLNETCVEHIRRIWGPRQYLFRSSKSHNQFYGELHRIEDHAGIPRPRHFGLQDLRSTAASEIERVEHGAARWFLQHARRTITERHYLDLSDMLADAVARMPQPEAFLVTSGDDERALWQKLADRRERGKVPEIRKQPERATPAREQWEFQGNRFRIGGGRWYALPGRYAAMLRYIVEAGRPCTYKMLRAAIPAKMSEHPFVPSSRMLSRTTIRFRVIQLRQHLREILGLPDQYDPIPCVQRGTWAAWTVNIPEPAVC